MATFHEFGENRLILNSWKQRQKLGFQILKTEPNHETTDPCYILLMTSFNSLKFFIIQWKAMGGGGGVQQTPLVT